MVQVVGTQEERLGTVLRQLALGGVGVEADGIVDGHQGVVGTGDGRVVEAPDAARALCGRDLEQGEVIHPGLVAGVAATLVDVVGAEVGQQEDMVVVVVRVGVHQQRLVSRRQIGQDGALGRFRTGRTLVGRVGGKEFLPAAGQDQGPGDHRQNLIEFHILLHLKIRRRW